MFSTYRRRKLRALLADYECPMHHEASDKQIRAMAEKLKEVLEGRALLLAESIKQLDRHLSAPQKGGRK